MENGSLMGFSAHVMRIEDMGFCCSFFREEDKVWSFLGASSSALMVAVSW